MYSLILAILSNTMFLSYVRSKSFELPLSKKEESLHLAKMLSGDTKSRDILIERNLRLVAHIVKKYENNYDLNEDLISIGTIGLIKGVDSYKPDKKTKLATYVSRCIENEILMHLRSSKKAKQTVSLNEVIAIDKDGGEIVLEDLIDSKQVPPIESLKLDEDINQLNYHLSSLSDIEYDIIKCRYGLSNSQKYTQNELAKKLKISRSYVSRIEKRALIKILKEYLNKQNL